LRRGTLIGLAAAIAAGPALASGAPGAGGPPADGSVWTRISIDQALELIAETGATVTDSGVSDEGFSINIQYASGLYAFVDGRECEGLGARMVCAEIETGGVFTADDEAHALRLERELSYIWVADHAEGNELTVWRRDCLHGGVTRGQVLHWITVMEEQLDAVSRAIWPDEGASVGPRNQPVET